MPIEEVLVYGTGGHARDVKDVIDAMADAGREVRCVGFLDDAPGNHGLEVNGVPVLGGEDQIDEWKTRARFLVGIGSPAARRRVAEKLSLRGGHFIQAWHPNAVATKYVEVGEGSVATAGVILTNCIRIGRHVLLNLGVTVGHDCVLEDYVSIAPGVCISGNVRIGEGTDVGTGTAIIQRVRIGRWSVIGAGSLVTKDVPDNCMVVGVPARMVRTQEAGWHLR